MANIGRPKLNIDPRQVELLAGAFCTNEEIAAKLGCCPDTLTRNFADSLYKGRECAKGSLRVMQFAAAKKGNSTMLIWLGKQYLGQKDKQDISGDIVTPELSREKLQAEIDALWVQSMQIVVDMHEKSAIDEPDEVEGDCNECGNDYVNK